jgi:hypothetical protein
MKITNLVFLCTFGCLFFLFSGPLHAATGMIEKVIFEQGDGKIESVIFHLNGPWLPKVFALKGDNPRVVFDFMETDLEKGVPTTINAQGSMVHKIRLGRHSGKTRVVIDLASGSDVNFDQQFDEKNNILTIQLFSMDFPAKEHVQDTAVATPVAIPVVESEPSSEPEQEVATEAVVVEEVPAVAPTESVEDPVAALPAEPVLEEETPTLDPMLLELNFEDTSNKGEMVLFKLNGFYPPVVTGEEEGTPLVICEFAGTRLGEGVQKAMEVGGKYIQRIQVTQLKESDTIRVSVELIASKNYDLQQVFFKEDNLFVIIVNSYEAMETKE